MSSMDVYSDQLTRLLNDSSASLSVVSRNVRKIYTVLCIKTTGSAPTADTI